MARKTDKKVPVKPSLPELREFHVKRWSYDADDKEVVETVLAHNVEFPHPDVINFLTIRIIPTHDEAGNVEKWIPIAEITRGFNNWDDFVQVETLSSTVQ